MLEALTNWMLGPYGGKTLLALRALFFLLFLVSAALLLFPGRDSRAFVGGRRKYRLLSFLFAAAFAALFACQAKWQLFGARNANLMRFMRAHNARATVEVRRGDILDRNGELLATDVREEGKVGRRHYPLGPDLAHVVGYCDPRFGLSGVERAADSILAGVTASPLAELGRLSRGIVETAPATGGNVRLTIDARIQRKVALAMAGKRGAVVVLRPDTGELLAVFSAPGFDPAEPGGFYGDAEAAPFLNRALQGKYPAGSTFKVAMALIAAEARIAPLLNCPADGFKAAPDAKPIRDSEYYIYRREGRKWNGFGKIGIKEALVHSSNVYFAQLAQKIPATSFNNYVKLMGMNEKAVLFSAEGQEFAAPAGAVPEVTDADRKARSQLAIGQGKMAVSPLNVAMWTSVVAAGGVLNPPRLEFAPPAGKYAPVKVVSRATAENVAEMMREAVKRGTGTGANVPGFGVCGKTGTAQNPKGDDHSWFTCFTSTTQPRLVVTVLVENGGFGSRNALPVAKAILHGAQECGAIKVVVK